MRDTVRSSESRVIRGRRYRVIDIDSRNCRTLHCVREADLESPYCHVCRQRRLQRRLGRHVQSQHPQVEEILDAMTGR